MTASKQILSSALVLLLSAATGCSVFDKNSGTGAGTTSGSMISGSAQNVETLRQEVADQERVTEEARLRAKSEEERLSAKKHQLKAAERELKADKVAAGG
jgi:hypothetical protein